MNNLTSSDLSKLIASLESNDPNQIIVQQLGNKLFQ